MRGAGRRAATQAAIAAGSVIVFLRESTALVAREVQFDYGKGPHNEDW